MSKAVVRVSGGGVQAERRRWTAKLKPRIVEESLEPGALVSEIARVYDVNANQVFACRRLHHRGLLEATGNLATLLLVRIVSDKAQIPVYRPPLAQSRYSDARGRPVSSRWKWTWAGCRSKARPLLSRFAWCWSVCADDLASGRHTDLGRGRHHWPCAAGSLG